MGYDIEVNLIKKPTNTAFYAGDDIENSGETYDF